MKRTLFISVSVAALFSATPAFAQDNASTVNQTGRFGVATVAQTGSGASSSVTQTGTDDAANVRQAGSGNSATIRQAGVDVPPLNTAPDDSTADDEGSASNFARALQNGSDGSITIDQTGNNFANVLQNPASAGNNSAIVNQDNTPVSGGAPEQNRVTSRQMGDNGSVDVGQTGDGNTATTEQGGDGNDSSISSVGNRNRAETFQTGTDGRSAINQLGDDNAADVTQGGSNSQSDIDQTGSRNTAVVAQSGADQRSTITQTGNDNDIGSQSGNGTSNAATAGVRQSGASHVSVVNQATSGATADVAQSGADSDSDIQQSGASSATVSQSGVNQLGGFTPDAFPNNRSLITQTVGGANADVSQAGTLNRSTIAQDAAATADVSQTGVFNNSTVNQADGSDGATASVTQGGDYGDNFSTINQSGDATAIVNQRNIDPLPPESASPSNESFIDQSADGAFANVDQTGDDNVSNVIQQSAATAQVIQNGTDNSSAVNQFGGAGGSTAVVAQGDAGGQSFRFADRPALDQGSVNNRSTVNQSGFDFAIVGQSGADNESRLTQTGDGDAFVQQVGSGNESEVTQSGFQRGRDNATRSFAIDVQQLGDDGFSMVNQSGGLAVPASQTGANRDGNIVTVRQQEGAIDARSTIDQGGTDNIASVTQGGIGNTSFLTQTGAANTATVSQMSDGNLSTVNQGGSGNTATVTQGM